MQRVSARNRSIDFDFTFDQWLDWWGDDIHNRGCKKGQLVMARKNDVGPYNASNVYKQSCQQNTADMRKRVRGNGK